MVWNFIIRRGEEGFSRHCMYWDEPSTDGSCTELYFKCVRKVALRGYLGKSSNDFKIFFFFKWHETDNFNRIHMGI